MKKAIIVLMLFCISQSQAQLSIGINTIKGFVNLSVPSLNNTITSGSAYSDYKMETIIGLHTQLEVPFLYYRYKKSGPIGFKASLILGNEKVKFRDANIDQTYSTGIFSYGINLQPLAWADAMDVPNWLGGSKGILVNYVDEAGNPVNVGVNKKGDETDKVFISRGEANLLINCIWGFYLQYGKGSCTFIDPKDAQMKMVTASPDVFTWGTSPIVFTNGPFILHAEFSSTKYKITNASGVISTIKSSHYGFGMSYTITNKKWRKKK